jgi:flagellar basal body-associated protein FliL
MVKNIPPEGEMKMPEEQFGVRKPDDTPSYIGIILGVLIVVLICILGGLYMWGELLQKNTSVPVTPEVTRPTALENNEPESNNAEASVETLGAMSTSDELDAIEADLGSTLIADPEADLQTITTELQTP